MKKHGSRNWKHYILDLGLGINLHDRLQYKCNLKLRIDIALVLYIMLRMSAEGDVNNLMDALQDLRKKLEIRDVIKGSLSEVDKLILSAIQRLRSISSVQLIDEDPALDTLILATERLLDESLSRKDSVNEAQEKVG